MNATALPGKVALKLDPELLGTINTRCKKKVIITGTNGKTTTNNLINHILSSEDVSVLSNLMGANMPQGVASAFLNNIKEEYDYGVFEVDEGSFPDIVKYIKPDFVVITNFFRDQLDRYGEIENTANMVHDALKKLETTLILNADDPLVSKFKDLGKRNIYYGVGRSNFSTLDQKIVESRFCPVCGCSLYYEYYNYGQLGKYSCSNCSFKNPEHDYSISSIDYDGESYTFKVETVNLSHDLTFGYDGIYNAYNCCAAIAFSLEAGLDMDSVAEKIMNFEYHLGRMENFVFEDKIVKIALVKNPVGLTEVLNSISHDKRKKSILLILNDNPADGKDISWIWDADVEALNEIDNLKILHCSGIRAQDMALRIKYACYSNRPEVNNNVEESVEQVLEEDVEIVYILPTYTAVFSTRELVLALLKHTNTGIPRIKEMVKNGLSTVIK